MKRGRAKAMKIKKTKPKLQSAQVGADGAAVDWGEVFRISCVREAAIDPFRKALEIALKADAGKTQIAGGLRQLQSFSPEKYSKQFQDSAAEFWKRAIHLALYERALSFTIGERMYLETLLRLAMCIGQALENLDETLFSRQAVFWRELCRKKSGVRTRTQVPRICLIAILLHSKLKRDPLKSEVKKAVKSEGLMIRDGDWPDKFKECGLAGLPSDKSGPRKGRVKRKKI